MYSINNKEAFILCTVTSCQRAEQYRGSEDKSEEYTKNRIQESSTQYRDAGSTDYGNRMHSVSGYSHYTESNRELSIRKGQSLVQNLRKQCH